MTITLDTVSHTPRPPGQQPPFVEHDIFPKTVGQVLLEVPDAPVVETPSPDLPPLEAVYMTAADVHATYTQGTLEIVLQDIRHKPFAEPRPTITDAPDTSRASVPVRVLPISMRPKRLAR